MGNWKLEVGKMVIYMAFPVACFHYFNQPDLFEDWVTKMKREIYPPENKSHRAEYEEAKRKAREEQQLELIKAMEQTGNKL
ncbi:protein PET100 homolog, mitochondrial [Onthophagus taurus]|uniref:protein PET100 homolog, mitochondrial n=1 Tax=Onthophagus taurus TaxID=166361 RepID=UPI000C20C3B7|nr:protein PET100 homolog, mitochondrial [Onthophagus taurus]